MLLQRWQSIVRTRPSERALVDLPTRRTWTFQELDSAARAQPAPHHHRLLFPSGNGPDFLVEVLRGWYGTAPLCPLDAGQRVPELPPPTPPHIHLKTTSATSGTARGVAFTADQLLADVDNIVDIMGLQPRWPNLATLSLAHSYGFSSLVLPLLCHGIPLVLVGSSLPDAVRQALSAFPELTLPAVPALWRAWSEAGVLGPSVKLAISAGAPLPLDLEHRVHARFGLKIHNFYGASECGGIAYDDSEAPRTEESMIGRPPDAVRLSIDNLGRLCVSGPAVGATYWPCGSETLQDGIFRTSDLVRFEGNRVHLLGRADDLIQVAGRKVIPELIERELQRHPEVRQCLVFGIDAADRSRTHTIVACVVVDGSRDPERFRAHLAATLPAWQLPRDWWFVDTLQPNARGKISRTQWRDRYLRDRKSR